jgi:hypothetical protein
MMSLLTEKWNEYFVFFIQKIDTIQNEFVEDIRSFSANQIDNMYVHQEELNSIK